MKTLQPLLRRPLLHVAGFSLVVNLLLLAPSLFMLQVFDRVLTSQSRETLLVLLLGMGVALALMFALDHLRSRLQGVAGNLIGESLAPLVTRLSLARAAARGERASADALRDVSTLRGLFSAQGLLALFDAPWVVVYVAVIWIAHPWLGAAAAAAAAAMLLLALLNDRLSRQDIDALQGAAAGAQRYLEASLANAEVAQALGMGDALIARWRARHAQVIALQSAAARKTVAMAAFTRMLRQAIQVLMLALGAYLVVTHEGTPGIMVATTILLGRALAPVEQVVGSWRLIAEARGAYRRLQALLAAAAAAPARMALPAPSGRLSAEGLAYRLAGSERTVLAGVSLTLEPGESLAIVGPSAAGKSTLLRLLCGVWTPSAGVVRLDQADLSQWPREQIGPWIGYVPQDVELFAGSVADNIARLGDVDADKVVRAAQRAGVHEMILSLPQGYDTAIDGSGAMLSPGQRQRIALARALYGDPKLVLLDEPNANLDGAGELALAEALKRLRGEATVVVVTHRTALVQHVDKMLVLEAGRAQHCGPTAEVLRALQAKSVAPAAGAQVVPMPARAAAAQERAS